MTGWEHGESPRELDEPVSARACGEPGRLVGVGGGGVGGGPATQPAGAARVGYAACHWCHVLAHESFEDAETAALMNEQFVSVKIDREVPDR